MEFVIWISGLVKYAGQAQTVVLYGILAQPG